MTEESDIYSEESFFEDLSKITPPSSVESTVEEIKKSREKEIRFLENIEKLSTIEIQSPSREGEVAQEDTSYLSDNFESDTETTPKKKETSPQRSEKVQHPQAGEIIGYESHNVPSKPDSSYGERKDPSKDTRESSESNPSSTERLQEDEEEEEEEEEDVYINKSETEQIELFKRSLKDRGFYEEDSRIKESDESINKREIASMRAAEKEQKALGDNYWGIDAAEIVRKEQERQQYKEEMISWHMKAEKALLNAFDTWTEHENEQRKIDEANQAEIEKIRRASYLSNFYSAEWSDAVLDYRWPPKGGAECHGVGTVNSLVDTKGGSWDLSTSGGSYSVNTARWGSSSRGNHFSRTAATASTIFNELKPEHEEIFNCFEREYQENRKLESRYKLVDINRLQIPPSSRGEEGAALTAKFKGRQNTVKSRIRGIIQKQQRIVETGTINDNYATKKHTIKDQNNMEQVPIHDGVQSIFHLDRKKRHIIPENIIRNTAAQRAAIQAAANSSDFDHEVKSRKRKAQKIVNRTKERLDKFLATDEQSMMIALFQAIDTKRIGYIVEAEVLRAIKYDEYVREIMQKTALWTLYKRGEIRQLLDLIFHPERAQVEGKSDYSIGRQVDFWTFYSCLQAIQVEENVPYKNIRPYRSSSLSAAGNDRYEGFSPLATTLLDNILPYEEGTRVEFLYRGGPLWQPGRILKRHANDTYTIKTDIFQRDRVLNLGLIRNKSIEIEEDPQREKEPVSGAGSTTLNGKNVNAGLRRKHRHEMDIIEDFFDQLWLEGKEQEENGINLVSFRVIESGLKQRSKASMIAKSKTLTAIKEKPSFLLMLSKIANKRLSKTEFRTYCDSVADILELNKDNLPRK